MANLDLKAIAELEARCIAAIEGQNWTDKPLTDAEKHLIGMTVSWTVNAVKEETNEPTG